MADVCRKSLPLSCYCAIETMRVVSILLFAYLALRALAGDSAVEMNETEDMYSMIIRMKISQ